MSIIVYTCTWLGNQKFYGLHAVESLLPSVHVQSVDKCVLQPLFAVSTKSHYRISKHCFVTFLTFVYIIHIQREISGVMIAQ